MKIQTPLHYKGAMFTESNMEKWNELGFGDKVFYKYIIEHDTTLSSMLLGIFSAYVVNLISNLITLKIENVYIVIIYFINLIFALKVLCSLIKLYGIHMAVEKQSEDNSISIRMNHDFEALYKSRRDEIASIIKSLEWNFLGIFITLLMCFAINNNLPDTIQMVIEWFKEKFREE